MHVAAAIPLRIAEIKCQRVSSQMICILTICRVDIDDEFSLHVLTFLLDACLIHARERELPLELIRVLKASFIALSQDWSLRQLFLGKIKTTKT